jgi:hypothetical protein
VVCIAQLSANFIVQETLDPGDDAPLTPDDRVVCIGPRRPAPISV